MWGPAWDPGEKRSLGKNQGTMNKISLYNINKEEVTHDYVLI